MTKFVDVGCEIILEQIWSLVSMKSAGVLDCLLNSHIGFKNWNAYKDYVSSEDGLTTTASIQISNSFSLNYKHELD